MIHDGGGCWWTASICGAAWLCYDSSSAVVLLCVVCFVLAPQQHEDKEGEQVLYDQEEADGV